VRATYAGLPTLLSILAGLLPLMSCVVIVSPAYGTAIGILFFSFILFCGSNNDLAGNALVIVLIRFTFSMTSRNNARSALYFF